MACTKTAARFWRWSKIEWKVSGGVRSPSLWHVHLGHNPVCKAGKVGRRKTPTDNGERSPHSGFLARLTPRPSRVILWRIGTTQLARLVPRRRASWAECVEGLFRRGNGVAHSRPRTSSSLRGWEKTQPRLQAPWLCKETRPTGPHRLTMTDSAETCTSMVRSVPLSKRGFNRGTIEPAEILQTAPAHFGPRAAGGSCQTPGRWQAPNSALTH